MQARNPVLLALVNTFVSSCSARVVRSPFVMCIGSICVCTFLRASANRTAVNITPAYARFSYAFVKVKFDLPASNVVSSHGTHVRARCALLAGTAYCGKRMELMYDAVCVHASRAFRFSI